MVPTNLGPRFIDCTGAGPSITVKLQVTTNQRELHPHDVRLPFLLHSEHLTPMKGHIALELMGVVIRFDPPE